MEWDRENGIGVKVFRFCVDLPHINYVWASIIQAEQYFKSFLHQLLHALLWSIVAMSSVS